MGCVNSQTASPSNKSLELYHSILLLDQQTINKCIDAIPLFLLHRLKQKFSKASKGNALELSEQCFIEMYKKYWNLIDDSQTMGFSNVPINHRYEGRQKVNVNLRKTQVKAVVCQGYQKIVDLLLKNLYLYFTDFRTSKLDFKNFVAKYAVINGHKQKLREILYFILSQKELEGKTQLIKQNVLSTFLEVHQNYFGFRPSERHSDVHSFQEFDECLRETGFDDEKFAKRFSLLEKTDMPFQLISRALMNMGIDDFEIGKEYYVLSNKWFERWQYYYQGSSQEESSQPLTYRSTKLNRAKQRKSNNTKRSSDLRRKDVSNFDESCWIVERPVAITYEDIEGEYQGELKQNIKSQMEIKVITEEIWQLITQTLPPEGEYRRVANSLTTLDLYPKNIYFLQADEDGKIDDKSWKNLFMSNKKTLADLSPNTDQQKHYYFVKNFNDKNWTEFDESDTLAMCSAERRFFVAKCKSKSLGKVTPNKKSIKTLTYGDRVYSFFTFNKKIMPAYIMRFPAPNKVLIHFEHFSFRYQIQTTIDSLSLNETELVEVVSNSAQKFKENDEFSFKGLINIGNTCFINSVIQCLIATPILEKYFIEEKFKSDKQPLLYEIAEIAKCLLSNKRVSPVKLKKIIDIELEVFSGSDQHDVQQFLSLLLEKLNTEIKSIGKQQSVLQYLFKGKIEADLQCESCSNINKIEQQFTTISLPIPEPEYNTFEILITSQSNLGISLIKQSDYLAEFEHRMGAHCQEFIFVEASYGNLRKVRHDFFHQQNQSLLLIDLSIVSSTEIHCFQRFRRKQFTEIQQQNKIQFKRLQYFDYESPDDGCWLYGRVISTPKVQILIRENTFSTIKLTSEQLKNLRPIGTKTLQLSYRRVTQRRFDQALKKMSYFSLDYMVAFPRESTFRQLVGLVDLVMGNFCKKQIQRKPYYVKLCEVGKGRCLFCGKSDGELSKSANLKNCCKVLSEEQMDTPLIWISREKNFNIVVDWIDFSEYNTQFLTFEIDNLSEQALKMKQSQKVSVEDCLRLHQKPQIVEMKCDKCTNTRQERTETMKLSPNILILHLKQFRMTNHGSVFRLIKLDVNLKWVQFLDLKGYCIQHKGTVYELYAYIRHVGTSQAGHYTCATKRTHPFEKKKVWVNFDDDVTTVLSNEQKNIDSAYLLFFRRVDIPNSAYINFTHF